MSKVVRFPGRRRRRVENPILLEARENVDFLPIETRLPCPPQRVFHQAMEANLCPVVIIGRDADGEFNFITSEADIGSVLTLLERAKRHIVDEIE